MKPTTALLLIAASIEIVWPSDLALTFWLVSLVLFIITPA